MNWKYYYNGYNTLTYNALFNFIIGNRGGGKSFWAKYWAINDFIKNGNEFIYVRRFAREMKKLKNFFLDIAEFFPETEFLVKGTTFYINGKKAGEALVLSTSKIEKSTSYPNVNKIIFDEFIIDKGVYHYLPNEVEYFLELYETIARSRTVRVFFLANAITQTNPYFIYFNIELPYQKARQVFYNDGSGKFTARRLKDTPDLLIELVANDEYIAMKKETRFGQLIAGTNYSDYAIDNTFLRDNPDFLDKKTATTKYRFAITYNGRKIGVWIDNTRGIFLLSPDTDPSSKVVYSFTTADHKINTMLVSSISKVIYLKTLFDNFKLGNVRFENMDTKNLFYEIAKLVNF